MTVSCAEGNVGKVYSGQLDFDVIKTDIDLTQTTKTKLMLNIANPDLAFEIAKLPADGAGLVRIEFIINHSVGVHPNALTHFDQMEDDIKHAIVDRMAAYDTPIEFFIDQLAQGIATIAAAFYPKPTIVRLSDFKSNEYASLIGGTLFEPTEENPMIGFRGASRYPSPEFKHSFQLECEALRRVREVMGLDNVKIMIPFVRTVEELQKVLALLKSNGLQRGANGLEVIVMCEIPANALLADDFLKHCDGFSIGSNDLTQLTLGVDRDSGVLTGYDERNPAVYRLIEMAIKACRSQNKYIGICGQAPSDFPEITTWLVQQGIESISLNPDSFLEMRKRVLETEQMSESPVN